MAGGSVTVSASTASFIGGTIANGIARYGGGIAALKGSFVWMSTTLASGNAAISGGVLYLADDAAVSTVAVTCRANSARDGGSAYISGTLAAGVLASFDAFDSTFVDNVASRRGGAWYVAGDSTVAVNGSTFESNIALVHGGGVYHTTSAVLSASFTRFVLNQVR